MRISKELEKEIDRFNGILKESGLPHISKVATTRIMARCFPIITNKKLIIKINIFERKAKKQSFWDVETK